MIALSSSLRRMPVPCRQLVVKQFLFGKSGSKDVTNNAGGMFGGLGDMMENIKKAREAMKQADVLRTELSREMVQGQDPQGLVTATFDGMGKPVSMKISEAAIAKGAEAASLAATKALIDAHSKSANMMQEKLQAMMPNMPMK